jgi:hypothetical protein
MVAAQHDQLDIATWLMDQGQFDPFETTPVRYRLVFLGTNEGMIFISSTIERNYSITFCCDVW